VLLVAACAGTAALTGEARDFFLVPTLIPFAVILVCLATIAVGRPLTGLALNRLAGGPTDWPRIPRLRRVYTISTLACVAINTVNAVVQGDLLPRRRHHRPGHRPPRDRAGVRRPRRAHARGGPAITRHAVGGPVTAVSLT
jgi:hypothetical protein